MIQLRDYQIQSVKLLKHSLRHHQRIVLCLPTGAGKTVVFSEVVNRAAIRETETLVVTDRVELFKQTFGSLDRIDISPQLINAETKQFEDSLISVAMIETLKRRVRSGKIEINPRLIIIDEAHKGNFTALFELFPDAKVIGATATPVGKHFHKYYTHIVDNIDIPELVEKGYLVPCKAYQMEEDLSDLKTRAGEYTEDSLMKHYNSERLFDGVIAEYKKRALGKKTLVFNVSIKHSENMNEAFLNAGVKSAVVTSNTSKEDRTRILKQFKDGEIDVLNNCGILTTGYDEPSIECIILNRATKSLPLFLQCCGRGSRLYPGKNHFLILDFGMNHTQHGMWSQPRKWTLEPPRKQKKKDASPVKTCPNCEALIFASAQACEFCGYVYPVKKKQLKKGVMIEVKPGVVRNLEGKRISQCTLDELAGLQQNKRFKSSFIWRVVRARGHEAVYQYSELMGYKQGWRLRQAQLMIQRTTFKDVII